MRNVLSLGSASTSTPAVAVVRGRCPLKGSRKGVLYDQIILSSLDNDSSEDDGHLHRQNNGDREDEDKLSAFSNTIISEPSN